MTGSVAKPQVMFGIHRMATHVLIGADLLYCSRLYLVFLPDFAQRLLLSTQILVSVFYIFIAVLRGYIAAVLISVACICLVIGQALIFEQSWSVPLNWNGIGQYGAFLSFVPIFIMARDEAAPYFVAMLVRYAVGYAFAYSLMSLMHSVGLLPPQITAPLTLNDLERGDRLYAHPGALAFAWYASLLLVQQRPTGLRAALFLVSALANVLTLSRVYLGCIAIVSALSVVRAPRRWIGIACFGTFGVLSAILVYGMIDTRWNPFFAFASNDTSGIGRALEYQIAQEIMGRSPMLGMGLTSFSDYHFSATGLSYFAPGDLGLVGVLLDYGAIGVLLFLVAAAIACAHNQLIPKPFDHAFFLLGCTFVLDSSISPNMFAPAGSFYFLVIFGLWLAQEAKPGDLRLGRLRSAGKT